MKLTIGRYRDEKAYDETFEPVRRVSTLLDALFSIRESIDHTHTFESGCRSGICGACAVKVDGRESLACSIMARDGMRVEPLSGYRPLRDLKVDRSLTEDRLSSAQAYLHEYGEAVCSEKDEERSRIQSDCILCGSCYSVCPVVEVDGEFIGPFALSRSYRYASDPRESGDVDILTAIQSHGVWDCTLCGECTAVCPQGVDSKNDILSLRSMSLRAGFSDPSFVSMDFGAGFSFDGAGF